MMYVTDFIKNDEFPKHLIEQLQLEKEREKREKEREELEKAMCKVSGLVSMVVEAILDCFIVAHSTFYSSGEEDPHPRKLCCSQR